MKRDPILKPADMTPDQRECYDLLCDLVFGEHHLSGTVRGWGKGIIAQSRNFHWLATWDFNHLTRLVFMAHDRCIRAEIVPSGPGMLGIVLHKRHATEGDIFQRHPTLDQAVSDWKARVRP